MSQSLATYNNENRVYSTRSCRQQCFYGNAASTENVLATTVSGDGHEVAQDFTLNYEDSSRLHNYKILQQQIIGQTIQSVEDIEKWLRYTSEHISNSESNVKSNVQAGLSEQLSGVPDKELLTDIEIAATKLNIDYDAMLTELQSNRALPTSEKDDQFIMPELRLDDLLPTQEMSDASSQYESDSSTDKSQKSMGEALENTVDNETELTNNVNATLMSIQDLSIETDSSDGSSDPNQCRNSENEPNSNNINSLVVTQQKSKRYNTRSKSTNLPSVKSKYEPSIIKRKRKVKSQEIAAEIEENNTASIKSVLQEKPLKKNKNVSTRRRKSPKSATSESSGSESDDLGKGRNSSYATSQELIVSKALEAVGITESSLEYFYNSQNIKTWRCHLPNCARHFAKLCYLKVHLMGHMNIKPFKCDYIRCSWAFYSEFKLKRHKETHLNKKDYICSIPGCERRFTTIYNLASHEKLHSRPNKIGCHVSGCTAKFQTKRTLENHMKEHDESLFPYACSYELCGKRFYSTNALMTHQRCHSYTPEDLTCSWPGCGKSFDLPCRKKAHMHYHTGQKPFACTFEGCDWAFPTSSKLKRHQKKHTKERNFVCDEEGCRKAFMRPEHLRLHKLTCARQQLNKSNVSFKCEYCKASFVTKVGLYNHIKKHVMKECENQVQDIARNTEKKNPVGSSGSESTSTEETENIALANMPVVNIVLNKMYKCPVEMCPKWYSDRSSLRIHLRKHNSAPLSEIQNVEEDNDEESVDDPSSTKPNEGAARTGFTREYVLSLKPDRQVVGSNEVGTVELSEGLLRDEGLPAIFCQEDDDSPAYQSLLFDNCVDVMQAFD